MLMLVVVIWIGSVYCYGQLQVLQRTWCRRLQLHEICR